MKPSFDERPHDQVIEPCSIQQSKPAPHWLEIELLGEDDGPIPWEEYLVELPSGQLIRGYLDEQGIGRLDRLQEVGVCRICFPQLDRAAWREL